MFAVFEFDERGQGFGLFGGGSEFAVERVFGVIEWDWQVEDCLCESQVERASGGKVSLGHVEICSARRKSLKVKCGTFSIKHMSGILRCLGDDAALDSMLTTGKSSVLAKAMIVKSLRQIVLREFRCEYSEMYC